MNLTKDKLKAAEIAVETVDFIESKINGITKNNNQKERFINLVLELLNDHYKPESYLSNIDRDILFVEMMNDCFYNRLKPRGFFCTLDNLIEKLRAND